MTVSPRQALVIRGLAVPATLAIMLGPIVASANAAASTAALRSGLDCAAMLPARVPQQPDTAMPLSRFSQQPGAVLQRRASASPPAALTSKDSPPPQASSKPPALDVKHITLENGLRIFVLERTASPTFAGLYQFGVGGATDPKGASGIAHLLEHMMFKGTESIGTLDPAAEAPIMRKLTELWSQLQAEIDKADDPFEKPDETKIADLKKQIEAVSAEHKKLIVKNEYDELMTRAGGVAMNASTGNDETNYYLELPSNQLDLWFRLESDRLLNPVFREFYSERDVVHEERRLRTENSPYGSIHEALDSVMFRAHPYGTPVVGWPKDIGRLQQADAEHYFRTYYSPSNCIMVFAGDLKAAEVERLARKYLSAWKKQEIPRLPITEEPEQKGERRSIVEFNAEPQLALGWVTVPAGHPDQYALEVLGTILGGLETSRMDKTIVQEERLAASVGAGQNSMKYSGTFNVSAVPTAPHTLAEVEAAINREIKKVQADGVEAKELERSKIRVEVGRVQTLKDNLGLGFQIVSSVATAVNVEYMREYEKRLNAVTAGQVQAVARKYLLPSKKCAVELHKVEAGADQAGKEANFDHKHGGTPGGRGAQHSKGFDAAIAMVHGAKPVTLKVPEIGKDVDLVKLPSGLTIYVKEDHSAPSVQMSFNWLGGSNTTPVEGLAPFQLASQLLDEGGTESLDPIALGERKEDLGMSFSVYIGATGCGGSFWSLQRNFKESFDLALDILMRPRFDEERLKTLKGQFVERMRRRYDSPGYGASLVQSWVLYRDHPRLGYVAPKKDVEAVTSDQIRAIWKKYMGRDNLFMTVVGDFNKKEMLALLDSKFAPWRKAQDKRREWVTRDPVSRPGVYLVEKDIPQPAVRITHQIKVDRTAPDEDHAAIEILNDILGGSGFRSRLMERLRSDEGLTYGIYSFISHEGRPGQAGGVGISYQTKKAAVAKSIRSVVEEFNKIIQEQVSPQEVQEQIEGWRNRFIFNYTDDFYSVGRLMNNFLDDRPYDQDRRELDAVQKVTVADVQRVAKRYLKPENLTISVFGMLTDEDKAGLTAKPGLTVLKKEQVFRGGYDDAAAEAEVNEGEGTTE